MGGSGDLARRRALEEHAKSESVSRRHRLTSRWRDVPYWASDHPILAVLAGAVGFLTSVVVLFRLIL
jgi:hypothetical protein